MILGIIPARYASTRFPGKPLVDIGGKTMIQRTYEQAKKATSLDRVVVATDDERIVAEVERFGGEYVLTHSQHPSGTDRCAEVVNKLNFTGEAVVNIQGDEPFIHPEQINSLCELFLDADAHIVTQVKPFIDAEALHSPNTAKVVRDVKGFAMYFTRSVVPFLRGKEVNDWLKLHNFWQHIGLYGYRTDVLLQLTELPPSSLELAESLEQLRWLENGYKIKTGLTDFESIAIDTPEDLAKLDQRVFG